MKRNQSGFTLVEIAIVLVIIGLLLGGVLKGQELISNSRAKAVYKDLQGVQTAVNSFNDRYRALPGDMTAAVATTIWGAGSPGGNGNGTIGAVGANPFNTVGENVTFWRQLRLAQFVTGDPAVATIAALPPDPVGGVTGVTVGAFGMNGNTVCSSNLTTQLVAMIDRQYDDGVNNTGTIRANTAATAAAAFSGAAPALASYVESGAAAIITPWVVCMQI